MYKIVNGTIDILDDNVSNVSNRYNTRAVSANNLACVKPKLKFFEKSLQFYGTYLWNSLPVQIRVNECLS